MIHRKSLQRRVMEQAEWIIMPKAIDLIANGKVSVVDGRVRIDENRVIAKPKEEFRQYFIEKENPHESISSRKWRP